MASDTSNNTEAGKLFTQAIEIDPSNEDILTTFAIFKCYRYNSSIFFSDLLDFYFS